VPYSDPADKSISGFPGSIKFQKQHFQQAIGTVAIAQATLLSLPPAPTPPAVHTLSFPTARLNRIRAASGEISNRLPMATNELPTT
jgi:hypothetical protein